MFGDVKNLQRCYHTQYISSCREDQGLSTEGKIVSKYCNISKNKGVHELPPFLTTVGV